MSAWKFADASRGVVSRVRDDGSVESCLAEREDVQEWVEGGNAILEPDPTPGPTADEVQEALAVAHLPLRVLAGMTQADIDAHIAAMFPGMNAGQKQTLSVIGRGLVVLLRREFRGRL